MKNINLSLKVAYIFLCIFTLMGLFFAGVIIELKGGGPFPSELLEFYKGNPDELKFGKTPLELAETSHFHSFISAVIVFLHSYFLSKTVLSEFWKATLVSMTFIGTFMLVLGPWIYTFTSELFIYLKYPSSILLVLGLLFMMFFNLREMFK